MIGLCSAGNISEQRVMRVLFVLAALGHGAVPLCPGVPQSQPPLPWDRPQLWKSGSKMGKCFPAGNFPQGQLSQADREFPLLPSPSCPHPPPLSLSPPLPPCLLRWPISHREIPLCAYQSSQHTPCLPGSFLLGVNPHLGKPFGPALCFCLWVLMGPSSASVLGAMGALGPFGVRDVCALGGKGESSCPSQSPPSLLLTLCLSLQRNQCLGPWTLGWAPAWSWWPLSIPAGVGTVLGHWQDPLNLAPALAGR